MGRNFGARPKPGVSPPPGSPTAHRIGCICPQEANAALNGRPDVNGNVLALVNSGCELHGWDRPSLSINQDQEDEALKTGRETDTQRS